MTTTAHVETIKILDKVRVCYVTNPATGAQASHGLGRVGDPILPYVGHRAEGYTLTLGRHVPELLYVRFDAPPKRNRYYPTRFASWSELEAPDLPKVQDLDDYLSQAQTQK